MKKRKDVVYEENMHGGKLWICDNPNTKDSVIDLVAIGMHDISIVLPFNKKKLIEFHNKIGEMIEKDK